MSFIDREDVEQLKKAWLEEPWGDLEETEGYQDYHDELLDFRLKHEAQSEKDKAECNQRRLDTLFNLEPGDSIIIGSQEFCWAPGGWIVKVFSCDEFITPVSTCFVPFPTKEVAQAHPISEDKLKEYLEKGLNSYLKNWGGK